MIKPIRDKLIVEPIIEENSQGSIFMIAEPDAVKGRVIAIGNKIVDIEVGDTVLYGKQGAIDFDDSELVIMSEVNIAVVL